MQARVEHSDDRSTLASRNPWAESTERERESTSGSTKMVTCQKNSIGYLSMKMVLRAVKSRLLVTFVTMCSIKSIDM